MKFAKSIRFTNDAVRKEVHIMKGIFTALLTPFNADYSINTDSLSKLVEFNLQKGIRGFYVGGSTGESMLMTSAERIKVFGTVKAAAGSRAELIAHVGAISTDEAIGMAKAAEALGYDAISAVAPFYYGFSGEAIKKYYADIVSSVRLPMFVYNFPASGGAAFTPEFAADMFRDERFIGIKHTSGNLFDLQQFKQVIGRDITVFNGYDEICLGGLSMGADGAIGSTYNFMGSKFIELYNAFNSGELEKAQRLQSEANEIISVLIKYGVFAGEKAILTHLGIDMGPCRRPFLPITPEGDAAMKKIAGCLE